jgi:hypothetical protein
VTLGRENVMATDWYMEGPYVKNCNCDPGCPCDFNQKPTHGDCEGMAAMRIDRGRFGDVDLSGLCWGVLYHWPGPLWEGNGDIQPIIDDTADERQTDALLQAMSGQHGDTFFEIIAFIAPNVKDPIVAPAEFEWDLEERSARVRFGDVLDTVTETLRGIDPPDPYRVITKIPGGMEYTNPDGEAEIARATTITGRGAIQFDLSDAHSSLAYVRRGPGVETAEFRPTVKPAS